MNYKKVFSRPIGGDDFTMNLGDSRYLNKIRKKQPFFHLPGKLSSTKPRTLAFNTSTLHLLGSKCLHRHISSAVTFCAIAKSEKGISG